MTISRTKHHENNVVVLAKLFWPEGGGAELATYLIVKNILSKWFNVVVISGTKTPAYDIHYYAKYVYNPLFRASTKPELLLRMFLRYKALEKFIRSTDVIYIPSNSLIPLAILSKKINPDAKVVVHLHDYQPISYASAILHDTGPNYKTDLLVELYDYESILRGVAAVFLRQVNMLYAKSMDYADTIVAVSKKQLEILVRFIPELKKKATVIYNPLPPVKPLKKVLDSSCTFLYAGGSRFTKGFHIFLKASLNLLKKGHRFAYFIVRDLSEKWLRIMERINKYYSGCYKIFGHIRHDQLLELHKHVLGLIFPSIIEEPLPYIVMESMILGTIPIASKVGGVPEIVNGSGAERFLFNPYDIDELTERIEMLTTLTKDQIDDLRKRMREHVIRKFSVDDIERKILHVFGI